MKKICEYDFTNHPIYDYEDIDIEKEGDGE